MFARRRDELEREANRIGALAVAATSRNAADLERLVATHGRGVRRHRHPRLELAAARRAGPAVEIDRRAARGGVRAAAAPRRPARRGSACRTCAQSEAGRDRLHHLGRRQGADRRTSRSRTRSARASPAGRSRSRASSGPTAITVNCVAPGPDRHAAHDGALRRRRARRRRSSPRSRSAASATPREFGDVVCFLASDRAAYVSGTTVPVDGGMLAVAAVRAPCSRPAGSLVARARAARGRARAAASLAVERSTSSCPTLRTRSRRSSPCRAASDPTRGRRLLRRRRRAQGDAARAAVRRPPRRRRPLSRPSAVNPPGVGEQQRRRIDLQDMQRSQEIAAAVALRAAGKKVVLAADRRARRRRRAGQAGGREARSRTT